MPLPSEDLLEADSAREEPPSNATKASERARYGETDKADDGKLKTIDDTPLDHGVKGGCKAGYDGQIQLRHGQSFVSRQAVQGVPLLH